MSVAVRPLTYDTLLDMPDDGNRYEIIGGELFVTAAPAEPHQWASIRLVSNLHVHVDANGLGQVYHAPVDVRLGPHNIVQPDIIFIRRERRHLYQGSIFEGPPDLVVEIFSPSTRRRDETIKLALYARSGVREYWMVDTDARSIIMFVLSQDGGYQRVEPVGGTVRSTVVPGFEVDVNAFFAMMV
ncbi:MAG: Uma2 family endonuclease [Thermomicrobiales bacterium]